MPKLTVQNMTNSPFDLEGDVRLPAMGEVTADFSEGYTALLRNSPGVRIVEHPEQPKPASRGRAKRKDNANG